jgi:iron only hydrogenase large subunit-like protein
VRWNREIGDLPLLSSECPGWVCYAEKTLGEDMFPFMSNIKSPQQLCGRLVKILAHGKGLDVN